MRHGTTRSRWCVVAFALALVSCAKVPITGRSQLNLIPSSEMLAMSQTQYTQFLEQNKESGDKAATAQVDRVGNQIKNAVVSYMNAQGLGDRIKDFKWEMHLVESKEVNAWCMPGGKMVVYTGLLPITKTDAGLAVVLGHEVGHAIAQHGNERMSQAMLAQLGGLALGEALKSHPRADAAALDAGVRRRRPIRRAASVRPAPGERSRPDRAGSDGDGGL